LRPVQAADAPPAKPLPDEWFALAAFGAASKATDPVLVPATGRSRPGDDLAVTGADRRSNAD